MRTARTTALLVLAIAAFAPRPAAPATIGARFFGGYNTYAMGDWNDIRRAMFIPRNLFSRGKDGYSLGGGLELQWRPSILVMASYERLVPGRQAEILGQKLRLPCNALLLEAEYGRRLGGFQAGVGGGGGYYKLGEEIEAPITSRNFEGSAFGAQAYGMIERRIAHAATFGLSVGYRWAKVDVSKVNLQEPPFEIDVDYSGLGSRLVLRLSSPAPR